jgi:hypothetical protein
MAVSKSQSVPRRLFPTIASAKRLTTFTDPCWWWRELEREDFGTDPPRCPPRPAPGTREARREVLALTYTVAAAGEMRDRVRAHVGKPIHSATFHDYCLDLAEARRERILACSTKRICGFTCAREFTSFASGTLRPGGKCRAVSQRSAWFPQPLPRRTGHAGKVCRVCCASLERG